MPEQSLLFEALKDNNYEEARELLKDELNLPADLSSFERIRLFDNLIEHKAFDIILLFVDHKLIETDIFEYDTFENTILQKIVSKVQDDEKSLSFLDEFLEELENINDSVNSQTLLAYALEAGAAPFIIEKLISAGSDTGWLNNAEQSFLHQVASNNRIQPDTAAAYLRLLISEGLDVNAQDIVKSTPLIIAISRNKTHLIDILLENGASANIPDKEEETAFYHAVVHQQNFKLYQKLKEYESPEFEHVSKSGSTLLFEFLKRLNRAEDSQLLFLKELLEDGADMYTPSVFYGRERTPSEIAAEKPFPVFNTIMQLEKLDITGTDQNGNSLLHLVCGFDINFDQEAAKDTYRKAKLLIEKGADVNLTNNKDETPLTLAMSDNLKTKTVELLLKNK